VKYSDPIGSHPWYPHQKTNDIGSDRDPKSVSAHKGDFYENPNEREHQYKERDHSCPKQQCGAPCAVEGPITNDIGSDREPKSVIAHKGDMCENPNEREWQ
jgi:hypothetical protein